MNKPQITTAEQVGISNDNISDKALQVVQGLQDEGFQAYLVGGCVRDLLLNKKPKDFDVATNATPEQVKATFKRNARIIGRRFKIVHVRFGYEVIEVATFRADASDRKQVGRNEMTEGDQGQLLRDNVYGTIEEDVVRRDFRANALYYDSVSGEILDFMGGIDDIRAGKLISIGDPETRFREDPVRMLRVIRFAAKLGFEMEPEALQMIKQEGKLLSHVSPARLFEEVLKLFHGGAAYETYLLLRKYGIFKYLFPFTDSMVIDGVEGMPERALQNTDKRVRAGKPVIPAFLFACMMWDPVKADARVLMDDGTPEAQAWRVAMSDGLRDQNQYVAVPRRLAEIILDIWNIHFRLIKRNPRMIKASLSNRRFRAAYDFLLLRTMVHEVDKDIADWWTEIQEQEPQGRDQMVSDLNKSYKQERQPSSGQGNELDGNSINYNSIEYQSGAGDNFGNGNGGGNSAGNNTAGRNSTRTNRNKPQHGRKKPARGKRRGARGKPRGDGGQANQQANGNSGNGNSVNSADPNQAAPNARRGKKRSTKRGGARRGPARGAGGRGRTNRSRNEPGSEGRFQDARPKDDYGNHSSDTDGQKKVKVRRKKRVIDAPEDKPVF